MGQALGSPIWFVLGLSGAGKSSLGAAIGREKGWLHLELDQALPGQGDGLEISGLGNAWRGLKENGDGRDLVREIRRLAASGGARGAVVTFPSNRVLSPRQIAALRPDVRVIYLVGPPASCLEAFLKRERESGRNLPATIWHEYNERVLKLLGVRAIHPYRVEAFLPDGRRKPIAALLSELAA